MGLAGGRGREGGHAPPLGRPCRAPQGCLPHLEAEAKAGGKDEQHWQKALKEGFEELRPSLSVCANVWKCVQGASGGSGFLNTYLLLPSMRTPDT